MFVCTVVFIFLPANSFLSPLSCQPMLIDCEGKRYAMSSNAEVGSPAASYDSNTIGRRRSTGKSPVTENDALSEMTKKVRAANV